MVVGKGDEGLKFRFGANASLFRATMNAIASANDAEDLMFFDE